MSCPHEDTCCCTVGCWWEDKVNNETPAEKAKRIGVPLVPAKPKRAPYDFNPVISVCGECGMEMRGVMAYSCSRSNCPCFPQVTF